MVHGIYTYAGGGSVAAHEDGRSYRLHKLNVRFLILYYNTVNTKGAQLILYLIPQPPLL